MSKAASGCWMSSISPLVSARRAAFRGKPAQEAWQVTINTQHQFDLSALLPKQAWYVAIYAPDKDELMFTVPMVDRPKRGGTLHIVGQ